MSPSEEDRCGASVSLAGARSCGVGALGPFPRDPGRGRARRATEKRRAGQRLSESRAGQSGGQEFQRCEDAGSGNVARAGRLWGMQGVLILGCLSDFSGRGVWAGRMCKLGM